MKKLKEILFLSDKKFNFANYAAQQDNGRRFHIEN